MNQEVRHAPIQRHHGPPPRQPQPAAIRLAQVWLKLPDERRQRTLSALSRVVVQQLAKAPQATEVAHERT